MADGKIVIELVARDEASQQFIAAAKAMGLSLDKVEGSGKGAAGAMGSLRGQMDDLTSSLERQLAFWLSLGGAMYVGYRALNAWYNLVASGVEAVDDYTRSIAGASVQMVAMSDSAAPPDQLYGEWKNYFQWLWTEAIKADQKAAASGREIFETAKELAVRGAVAETEAQIEAVARLTDRIKALTRVQGEDRTRFQIAQEIRALYEGQLTHGASLVQMLSKIDKEWKKNLQSAVATGTVLEYLDKMLPRIEANVTEISNTWESVYSTLTNIKSEILREAFGEGYRDLVGWGKEIVALLIQEGELTERGQALARALAGAWSEAKESIAAALKYFLDNPEKLIGSVEAVAKGTGRIASAAVTAASAFADLVQSIEKAVGFLSGPYGPALMGAAWGSRWGIPGAAVGGAAGLIYGVGRQGTFGEAMPGAELETFGRGPAAIRGLIGYGTEGEGHIPVRLPRPAPRVPPVRPPGGKLETGAGGRAEEAAQRRLENLMQTLRQEIARGTEDTYDDIREWANKFIMEIERVEGHLAEKQIAKELLAQAQEVKLNKVFEKQAQEAVTYFKKQQEDYKEFLGTFQNYYSSLAAIAPALADQNKYRELALAWETKISEENLRQLLLKNPYLRTQEEELRGLQALMVQSKKFAEEQRRWQTEGYLGGLKGWAWGRREEAATRDYREMQSLMQELERGVGDTLASGIINALRGKKVDMAEMGLSMAEAFIRRSMEGLTARMFDEIAKWVSQFLGIVPPMQAGAQTAAATLAAGGVSAGQAMVAGAIQAAAILQGGFSGDMMRGLLGIIGGIGGGLSGDSLAAMLGGGLSGDSLAAMLGGGISAYQHGGIVTRPTLALVGEAGPEAIIPLHRGGEGLTVTVINQTGVAVEPEVRWDGREMEITLSRLVARDIDRGGEVHRSLQRNYRLHPKTAGR